MGDRLSSPGSCSPFPPHDQKATSVMEQGPSHTMENQSTDQENNLSLIIQQTFQDTLRCKSLIIHLFTILNPIRGHPFKPQQEGYFGEARSALGMLVPGGTAAFWGWLLGRAPRWLLGCTPAAPQGAWQRATGHAQCLHSSTAPQIKTPHGQHSE